MLLMIYFALMYTCECIGIEKCEFTIGFASYWINDIGKNNLSSCPRF